MTLKKYILIRFIKSNKLISMNFKRICFHLNNNHPSIIYILYIDYSIIYIVINQKESMLKIR